MQPPQRISLITKRLSLVPLGREHADALFEAVESSRDHLARGLSELGRATREEVAGIAISSSDEWHAGTAFRFAVLDDRGTLIGSVAIETEDGDPCEHLAFWLREDATGDGRMTEAATAAVLWAFGTVGLPRIRANAACENVDSKGVLGRLGFRHVRTAPASSKPQRLAEDVYVLSA